MRIFATLFLLLPTSVFAESICEPKIDAFIGQYQVYRLQGYNEKISKCIPINKSFIQVNGFADSKVDITGFVVGIESFWSSKLGSVIKVTSKAGGHTTIVKLLAHKHGANNFSSNFDENFSSSMGYITVSKEEPGNLTVKFINNYIDYNCQWIIEDVYVLLGEYFSIISSDEIIRKCT